MDALLRDFRLAVRSLLRVPLFSAVAVLTLGIGLGTTSLMFTTANAAFLQPLPFPSDGLVRIWQVSQRSKSVNVPPQVWRDWQQGLTSVTSLAASGGSGAVNVSNGADAERAVAASVSRNFFKTFGVSPAIGRSFSTEEATPNGPIALVISNAIWDRFFGRSADVLTRTLKVEGVSYPIVGVMPAGFNYPEEADLWVTFERQPDANTSRTAHEYEVIGRRMSDASVSTVQAEVEALTRSLHVADEPMRREGYGTRVVDFRSDLLDTSTGPVTLLLAAVACVLLIACANVINLLLARSISREAQTTLRVALGASTGAITRVFVMESLALSIAGGALGAVLMFWAGELAAGLIPATFLARGALRPDLTVFAVLVGLMFVVGVLCGLVPSRHAAAVDLRSALAAGSQTVASEPRTMRVMIAAEVALGVVLLVGAGLLLGSLLRLQRVDPGFRRNTAVVGTFSLGSAPGSAYETPAARAQFYDRMLERVGSIPGVMAAGVTTSFPFGFSSNALLDTEGVPLGEWGRAPETHYRLVGGKYFEGMGAHLVAGRLFNDGDRAGSALVAIVNDATVRILWNGQNPIGRRVRQSNMDNVAEYATVVGVVSDMHHRGLTRPAVSEVYFPYRQRPQRTYTMTLVAQTGVDAASMTGAVRAEVKRIDPAVPVKLESIDARLDTQLAAARFRTRLFTGFAATAVALAALGIFGVVTYSVAARKREMGIRLALGARAADVRRLVLRRALTPVAIGLVIGINIALFTTRLLSGLLFGVHGNDPLTFVIASALLLVSAVAAAWWPAHRATRVDPLATLRSN
jgi:putative ABC transport system permease protein